MIGLLQRMRRLILTKKINKGFTMDEKYSADNDVEISLIDYWRIIMKRRKLIGKLVLASVILTVIVSLMMKNIYGANAIITPIAKDTSGNMAASLMSQVGGMASMFLPESASSSELQTLLKSNVLRERVITQYNLLPILFPDKWDENTKNWKKGGGYNPLSLISSLAGVFRPADKKAIKKDEGAPDIWDGLRRLDGMVQINNNIKDKTITIQVQFDDPVMAANIVGYFLAALNDHMRSETKRVTTTNRKYLEEQLIETADPYIRQKIYNLIAQQIETSMMAEVKENYAFKVLEPPRAPDRKIKPNRSQMVLMSLFVSLLIGAVLAVFLESLEKQNIRINIDMSKIKLRLDKFGSRNKDTKDVIKE